MGGSTICESFLLAKGGTNKVVGGQNIWLAPWFPGFCRLYIFCHLLSSRSKTKGVLIKVSSPGFLQSLVIGGERVR